MQFICLLTMHTCRMRIRLTDLHCKWADVAPAGGTFFDTKCCGSSKSAELAIVCLHVADLTPLSVEDSLDSKSLHGIKD